MRAMSKLSLLLFVCLILCQGAHAQPPGAPPMNAAATAACSDGDSASASDSASAEVTDKLSRVRRFLKIDNLVWANRYRFHDDAAGITQQSDWQFKVRLQYRVLLEREGRVYLGSRVATGPNFQFEWNNTGVGRKPGSLNLAVRDLYLGVKPAKRLEIEVGGIPFLWGAGTDATYFNDCGFLTGYRVRVEPRSAAIPLDWISATFGFVGDPFQPNFFARAGNLRRFNYAQILAGKKFTRRLNTSAEYDRLNGADYVRVAAQVEVPALRLIDGAIIENIARVDQRRANGFAVMLNKKVNRLQLVAGLSNVDAHIGFLNADQIDYGKLMVLRAKYPLSRDFDLAFYYGRRLDHRPTAFFNRFECQLLFKVGNLLNRVLQ